MVKYTIKNRKRTYRKRTHKKKTLRKRTHKKRTYKKKNTKLKGGLGFNKGIIVSLESLNRINRELESKINNIDDILLSIENIGFRKYKFTSSYKKNGVIETKVIEKKTSDYNKLLTSLDKIPPISINTGTGKRYLNLSTEHFIKNVKDIMNCTNMLFFTKSQRTIECMEGTIKEILRYAQVTNMTENWTETDYTNICKEIDTMRMKYICKDNLEDRIKSIKKDNTFLETIKHIKLKRYSLVLRFLGIINF